LKQHVMSNTPYTPYKLVHMLKTEKYWWN